MTSLGPQIILNDRPHKKLDVWKKSIDFVSLIYEETKSYPRDEEFGLKSQLRRAAVSVPSNIAEGLTRKTPNDKLHFLNIAQASLSEIDTQLEISLRLRYLDEPMYCTTEEQLVQIQKLLSGLVRKILG
jgi:four helix bundle protein